MYRTQGRCSPGGLDDKHRCAADRVEVAEAGGETFLDPSIYLSRYLSIYLAVALSVSLFISIHTYYIYIYIHMYKYIYSHISVHTYI